MDEEKSLEDVLKDKLDKVKEAEFRKEQEIKLERREEISSKLSNFGYFLKTL